MDLDPAVLSFIPPAEVIRNPPFGVSGRGIIAVIENHQLDSAEARFCRVIIGAALGKTDPMDMELVKEPPRLAGLTRMRRILIKYHPENGSRIAPSESPKKTADIRGALTFHECPMNTAGLFIVRDKEVKEAPSFLARLKYESALGSIAPSSVRFHGNGLIIEEEQMALFYQMSTSPPDSR